MSLVESPSPFQLPDELLAPLHRLRGLIHRYVMLQGLVVASLFAIVSFWIFGWCDYLPIKLGANESPRVARGIMLAIFILGFLHFFARMGLMKRWVHWPESSLSLLIERRFPSLESSLSTAVLGASKKIPKSEDPELDRLNWSMLAGSRDFAVSRMGEIQVERVLDWSPLRWQTTCLAILSVASLSGIFMQPAWTSHWAKRFFALSDEPWPRKVRLLVEGIEMDIPSFSGETDRQRYLRKFVDREATIAKGRGGVLRVVADREAPRVPEYCSVYYRSEDGTGGRANLRRLATGTKEWEPFVLEGPPLESVEQDIQFSVAAEDLKLPRHSIRLVESPIITSLALQVEYPSYLQRTTNGAYLPEKLEYRNGQRIPQGTGVVLVAKTNKPLQRVDYVIANGSEADAKRTVTTMDITGDTIELPIMQVNTPNHNTAIELRLWDSDGLCADRILQYSIAVVEDETPRVDLILNGIGSAVTPNATIPFVSQIRDDHGTRSTWLEMVLNESAPLRVDTAMNAEGKIEAKLELEQLAASRQLPIAINTTLSMTMAADDHFDLGDLKHVGRASPIQLAIVKPDDLSLLLEKRELAMRARLEQVIGEMTQMRELTRKIGEPEPTPGTDEKQPVANENEAATKENGTQTKSQTENEESRIRLRQLRTQQSSMQASKSEGELRGIAREIRQISMELVNNKIDSKDKRERLESKVQLPIQVVVEGPYSILQKDLKEMEVTALKEQPSREQVLRVLNTTDDILVKLNEILKNMIELQDFNEVLDMVRDLIDDQEKLLDATKKEQKKQVIDLFPSK